MKSFCSDRSLVFFLCNGFAIKGRDVSFVDSQPVRFFIEGVGYRAFSRPAVTTTEAVSGLIKAGQRQPHAGMEN
jgi:hypothetical protein